MNRLFSFQLGPNGYTFATNANGDIVFHPYLRFSVSIVVLTFLSTVAFSIKFDAIKSGWSMKEFSLHGQIQRGRQGPAENHKWL